MRTRINISSENNSLTTRTSGGEESGRGEESVGARKRLSLAGIGARMFPLNVVKSPSRKGEIPPMTINGTATPSHGTPRGPRDTSRPRRSVSCHVKYLLPPLYRDPTTTPDFTIATCITSDCG